jgi:hypothetical protein
MKSRRRLGVPANLRVYLTPIERLVTSGRASRPKGDLLELGPPPKRGHSRSLSQALQGQRAGRF